MPDAPENDDRLKTEDQKNQEVVNQNEELPQVENLSTPMVEPIIVPVMTAPIVEQLFQETPAPGVSEPVITQSVIEPIQEIPVIEETPVPVIPVINEATAEETKEELAGPSIMTEEMVVPTTATSELNDDMKIIEDME